MATADLLVVGLGNPEAEYGGTRHNVGADAVRLLGSRHGVNLRPERGTHASTATAHLGGRTLVLAVPQTYMNDSGVAVRALATRYLGTFADFDPGALVVVHDELDLEPGVVRVKVGGGTAGHNGLRSINSHLKHLELHPGPHRHRQAPGQVRRRRRTCCADPRRPSASCSTSPSRSPRTPSRRCSTRGPRRR